MVSNTRKTGDINEWILQCAENNQIMLQNAQTTIFDVVHAKICFMGLTPVNKMYKFFAYVIQ